MKQKIAIIGAGISGLVLAQKLQPFTKICVFERNNHVGGRMATHKFAPFSFDHGAHTFTARTPEFQEFLQPFIDTKIVAQWHGNAVSLEINKPPEQRKWREPHMVACPDMNSLCDALKYNIDIRLNTKIVGLRRICTRNWQLIDDNGKNLGDFNWVIATMPPRDVLKLFDDFLPETSTIRTAKLQPCYSLMIGFNKRWEYDWGAAKVRNNPLKWISINSSKPSRNTHITSIVALSRGNWAEKHLYDKLHDVQSFLVQQFESVTGISCVNADYLGIHKWDEAIVENTQKLGIYFDEHLKLAATSDWASTSRIEEVWMNAHEMSNKIINTTLL